MKSPPSKKNLILRSLAISAGLTVLKLFVFVITNSMAILASAADSFLDFLVSLANFIFVRTAAKPADEDHPYGHGKVESLAGLIQSLFIAAVTVGIAWMSIQRLKNPTEILKPGAGLFITVIALLFSIWHARNLKKSMVSSGSQLMASEYLHYASDILAYVGVIASLLLAKFTGAYFWDPVISLFIVVYLMKSVASIFNNSLGELMDQQLPDPFLKEIDQIIRSHSPKVVGYHDLRTRKVSHTKFIEFHVVLRDVEKFVEAHDITERLIMKLRETYPGSVITVHPDPFGVDDPTSATV